MESDGPKILRALVGNLTRIFQAYGWDGENTPKHFSDKLDYIAHGLTNGDAQAYYTHLKMIIQVREKDHQWGIFAPFFVVGTCNMLKRCGDFLHWFEPGPHAPITNYKEPRIKGNVFKKSELGRDALERLRVYGKTNIRYSFVEEYGLPLLRRHLREAGYPDATIKVIEDNHIPDALFEDLVFRGEERLKLETYWPFMPLVILSNKRKEG